MPIFTQLILEAIEAVHGPDKKISEILALLRQQSKQGRGFGQNVDVASTQPFIKQVPHVSYPPIPAALPPIARSASMLADLWPTKNTTNAASVKPKAPSVTQNTHGLLPGTPRFFPPPYPQSPTRTVTQPSSPITSVSTSPIQGKGKAKVPLSSCINSDYFSSSSSSLSNASSLPYVQPLPPEQIPLPPSPLTATSSSPSLLFEEIEPYKIPLPPSPNAISTSQSSIQSLDDSSQPRLDLPRVRSTLTFSSPLLTPATPPAEQVQHLAALLIKRGLLQVGAITTTGLGMLRNLPPSDDAILSAALSIISAGIDALEIPGQMVAIKTSEEKKGVLVARLCETLAQTYIRSEGVACQITKIAGTTLPLGAAIPAPILSLATSLLEVVNSIRAVIRFVGVYKVATTLIFCLSNIFELKGLSAPDIGEFESTWKKRLATGQSTATTIPDINFSALVWFCYKYKRGIAGIIKTHTERLAVPLLALGGTILGMVILTASVPIAGQITAGVIGSGLVAIFGLGFSIYRTGKYIQSRNALREILKDEGQRYTLNATRAQLELLAACLSAKHTIGGFFKWGGDNLEFNKNPHSIVPGATVGDFFRLKLALMLMHFLLEEHVHYDGVFSDPIENHRVSRFLVDVIDVRKDDKNQMLSSMLAQPASIPVFSSPATIGQSASFAQPTAKSFASSSSSSSTLLSSQEIDEDDMFDDKTFYNYVATNFNIDLLYSFFVGVLAIIIKDISNINWNKKLKTLSNLYSEYINSIYNPSFGFTGQATVQTEIKIKVVKEFFELIRVNM